MNAKIETVLVLLTLGASSLVLIGNIYAYSYYESFDVNIYDYISLSEIPSFFLPILLRTLSWLVLLAFCLYLGIRSFLGSYHSKLSKTHHHIGKKRVLLSFYKSEATLILGAFLVFMIATELVTQFIDRWDVDRPKYIPLVILLLLLVSRFTLGRRRFLYDRKLQYGMLLLTGLLFIHQVASWDAYVTKHFGSDWRQSSRSYIFSVEGNAAKDTVVTSKQLQYIGRTSSTVFFLKKDSLVQRTLIYRRDKLQGPEINSLELAPLPEGNSHW